MQHPPLDRDSPRGPTWRFGLARVLVCLIALAAALGAAVWGATLSTAADGLGVIEVLARAGLVAMPLLALAVLMLALIRRLDADAQRELAALAAATVIPAILWTAFLLFVIGVGVDGFGVEEADDEWAVVTIPLVGVSALLFGYARAR